MSEHALRAAPTVLRFKTLNKQQIQGVPYRCVSKINKVVQSKESKSEKMCIFTHFTGQQNLTLS
jgi:hypothetical protein